jgi:hypothetical protein
MLAAEENELSCSSIASDGTSAADRDSRSSGAAMTLLYLRFIPKREMPISAELLCTGLLGPIGCRRRPRRVRRTRQSTCFFPVLQGRACLGDWPAELGEPRCVQSLKAFFTFSIVDLFNRMAEHAILVVLPRLRPNFHAGRNVSDVESRTGCRTIFFAAEPVG